MQIGGERLEDATECAFADPALKATMTGLRRRIAIRQVLPGAPVRRIQRMPFNTSRGSRHGRPRRSRRTRGFGKSGARMAHCASVRSMPSSTDGQYTLVSPCHFGICEIGSSVLRDRTAAYGVYRSHGANCYRSSQRCGSSVDDIGRRSHCRFRAPWRVYWITLPIAAERIRRSLPCRCAERRGARSRPTRPRGSTPGCRRHDGH